MSGVVITEKDRFVMEFLYKFRIATSIELSALLNVTNSGVYKRMKRLENVGLVKKQQVMILEHIYFLSNEGYRFLNKKGREVNLNTLNIFHELFLTKIGTALLRDTSDLELSDIYTEKDQFASEKDFFKASKKAFPDLYIPKYKVIVEYERTEKTKERIKKKIMNNFENFTDCSQMWILPRARKSTIEMLKNNDFFISAIISEEYVEQTFTNNQYTLDLKELIKY